MVYIPGTSKKVGYAIDQRTSCVWSGNTFYNGNAGVCYIIWQIVNPIFGRWRHKSRSKYLDNSGTTSIDINSSSYCECYTEAKEPHIKVCSTQDDITQMRLVICGFNFDSKHKANLLIDVPGKGSFWIRNIPVDRHGKFQAVWTMADCSNVPTSISGYEFTGQSPSKSNCRLRRLAVVLHQQLLLLVKPTGFSSNFVS